MDASRKNNSEKLWLTVYLHDDILTTSETTKHNPQPASKTMYALVNTFHNNKIVSRHRTINNAAKANAKYQRDCKRCNGESSYMPTKIMQIVDGSLEPLNDVDREYSIFCTGWNL